MAAVTLHVAGLAVAPQELARLERMIDPAERAQAARFRLARDRRRFIARRGSLRMLLGAESGTAPDRLVFTANRFGKPLLADGPQFSLSHSGDVMLLAICDHAVGCDIEQVHATADWRAVAATLFSPGERNALAAMPEAIGRRAFFDCWARKEAFVKAIGLGLSYPLDAFDVSLHDVAEVTRGGAGWRMIAVPDIAGCVAAVVASDDGGALTVLDRRADAALAA